MTINISKKHLDMNRKIVVFYDKIKIWIKCLMAEKKYHRSSIQIRIYGDRLYFICFRFFSSSERFDRIYYS